MLSLKDPVLLKIKSQFSMNAVCSAEKCACGGLHHPVVVYNNRHEEITRLCPIVYWMRWYLLSMYDSDIPRPDKSILEGLLQ